jgi:hypothetical protein
MTSLKAFIKLKSLDILYYIVYLVTLHKIAEGRTQGTDYSYKQIVHLTSNALIVAVQDSCRGSFRLVRANLKCEPINAEF